MSLNDPSHSHSENSDLGPESMANSVTRHALISQSSENGSEIEFINYGIDTLDTGFYVQ